MTQRKLASFATRRDADMAIEHLIQEYGVDADAISAAAASEQNSAGIKAGGGDLEAGQRKKGKRTPVLDVIVMGLRIMPLLDENPLIGIVHNKVLGIEHNNRQCIRYRRSVSPSRYRLPHRYLL